MTVKETDKRSHNYCPNTFVDQEGPNGLRPGEWRQDTQNMNGITSIQRVGVLRNYGDEAKWVREQFKDYFSNEGAVDWQWNKFHRAR